MASLRSTLLLSLAAAATARDIPSNVRDFYNSVRGQGQCSNKLKSGFHSIEGDDGCTFFSLPSLPSVMVSKKLTREYIISILLLRRPHERLPRALPAG